MDTIQINSLEQVPAGLNFLLKRIDDLEAKIDSKPQERPITTPSGETLRTRTETAKILRVTLATLNEYTKTGKIVANRIGNRVLYRDSDIQKALSKVNTSNL